MNSVIYEHTSRDSCEEFTVLLDDNRSLSIGITPEGIIMEVFQRQPEGGDYDLLNTSDEDVHLGTAGMMFDEWADWIVREDITL